MSAIQMPLFPELNDPLISLLAAIRARQDRLEDARQLLKGVKPK